MNGGRRTIPAWWQATGPSAEPSRTSRSTPWSSSSTRCGSGGRARAPSSSRGPAWGGRSSPSASASCSSAGSSSRATSGPAPAAGRRASSRSGRRPAIVLVADLGATSIDVAMTTLDGRILAHRDEPASIEAGPEACLDRVEELFDQLLATTQGVPGPAVGDRHRRPGPGRVRDRPADLAADHARLGRLPDPGAVRRALRRPGLGRQRRQPPRPRGVAVRRRGRPRRRRRRQDRDGDRGRDHLRRPAPSRRAGQRRRRRPHPGHRGSRRSSAAAATSAASRRWPAAARWGGRARTPPLEGRSRAAPDGARPARHGDRRGRRAGRVVRRPGRGRDAPGRGPARSARCSRAS